MIPIVFPSCVQSRITLVKKKSVRVNENEFIIRHDEINPMPRGIHRIRK